MKTAKIHIFIFLCAFISPSVSANFYETLGVEITASRVEIVRAYHKRAAEIHTSSHSKKEWLEVRQMRNVLLNPKDRAQYDRWITSLAYRKLRFGEDAPEATDSSQSEDFSSSRKWEKKHSAILSENLYEALEVEIDASTDKIERASHSLGIKLQTKSQPETAWQTVHTIRGVLLNSVDREQYDQWITSDAYRRLQFASGSSRQLSHLTRSSHSQGLFAKKTPKGGSGVSNDLHQALSHSDRDTAKQMAATVLQWDVDLTVRDNKGRTAFLLTIEKYFPKLFERILAINGGDVVNIPDNDNNFPTHWAILRAKCAHCTPQEHEKEALTMLQSLDKHYADFSVRNNNGKTPLHLAFDAGLMKIVHWILSRKEGAGYLTKQERDSLVSSAIERGDTEIVNALLNPPDTEKCTPSLWKWMDRLKPEKLKL